MARKKLVSKATSTLKPLIWLLCTVVSGGGFSAFLSANWPLVGSLLGLISANAPANPGPYPGAENILQSLEESLAHVQLPATPGTSPVYVNTVPPPPIAGQPLRDKLLIASFNIQVFGESKLAKPEVVGVLAQVIRQFDIVAIQEVRAKSDEILPRFLQAINADGSHYSFLIGPRLGRTVSTEQYAFIYDTRRVEYDPSAVGTMPDPTDQLHREPFIARFRTRTNFPDQAFSFWLVNIHTDPDEVPQEVAALADVFQAMQRARPDEDDVILLGDLNASEKQLGRLGQIPGIRWVVSGAMTNTRKDKAYDNVLFHGQATNEYTGRWGVFDLESAFGLTREQALQVSDHLPIWAEFRAWETRDTGGVVGRGPGMQR